MLEKLSQLASSRRIRYLVWALLTLGALVVSLRRAVPIDGQLLLKVYDVGQGDAILILTPEGHRVLIDGGPDETILSLLGEDFPTHKWLDLLVLTHPHADHLTGLTTILPAYQVGGVVANPYEHETPIFRQWQSLLEGIELREAYAGDVIELGGVTLKVLWPPANLREVDRGFWLDHVVGNLNNTSLVLLLTYGDFRALLMGDAEIPVQEAILAGGELTTGTVTVLKVPHQGSKDALSAAFLEAVKPDLAVISVGKNSFGHPSDKVIAAYEERGIKLLRTDEVGSVTIRSDGTGFSLY